MASDEIDRYCEVMHDAYEKAAVGAGWETQEASRVRWEQVPEANKVTMRAAVGALLDAIRTEGALTDDEWRAFQAIPDQGYSHRAWIDARIAERTQAR